MYQQYCGFSSSKLSSVVTCGLDYCRISSLYVFFIGESTLQYNINLWFGVVSTMCVYMQGLLDPVTIYNQIEIYLLWIASACTCTCIANTIFELLLMAKE